MKNVNQFISKQKKYQIGAKKNYKNITYLLVFYLALFKSLVVCVLCVLLPRINIMNSDKYDVNNTRKSTNK